MNPAHDHPVAAEVDAASDEPLFAEFANTLALERGQPDERLPDADSLLAWLAAHGLLSDRSRAAEASALRRNPDEAVRRLERFRHLRSLISQISRRVAERRQPTQRQVSDLNHVLRHGLHYHQLQRREGDARYRIATIGDRLDQARAEIASSLARFLAADDLDRMRICANDACQWVFVDRSPTGRRRWCDMRTCGNQAKVARHRARRRATSGAEADARLP